MEYKIKILILSFRSNLKKLMCESRITNRFYLFFFFYRKICKYYFYQLRCRQARHPLQHVFPYLIIVNTVHSTAAYKALNFRRILIYHFSDKIKKFFCNYVSTTIDYLIISEIFLFRLQYLHRTDANLPKSKVFVQFVKIQFIFLIFRN